MVRAIISKDLMVCIDGSIIKLLLLLLYYYYIPTSAQTRSLSSPISPSHPKRVPYLPPHHYVPSHPHIPNQAVRLLHFSPHLNLCSCGSGRRISNFRKDSGKDSGRIQRRIKGRIKTKRSTRNGEKKYPFYKNI